MISLLKYHSNAVMFLISLHKIWRSEVMICLFSHFQRDFLDFTCSKFNQYLLIFSISQRRISFCAALIFLFSHYICGFLDFMGSKFNLSQSIFSISNCRISFCAVLIFKFPHIALWFSVIHFSIDFLNFMQRHVHIQSITLIFWISAFSTMRLHMANN